MHNSSILYFLVEPLDPTLPESLAATPVLDGVPLTRLIDEFETSQGFDAPGGYAGLLPRNHSFGPIYIHFLADLDEFNLAGDWEIQDVDLLGCSCGDSDCWPLKSSITKSTETVTWSNFTQPHRPDRLYTGFGPFHFNLEQYKSAVNQLAEQFLPKAAAPESTRL